MIVFLLLCFSFANAFNFKDTLAYLDTYGYIKTEENELININESDVKYLNALKLFQDYYNLPYDNLTQTTQLMKSRRCGVADVLNYNLLPHSWNLTTITWDFISGNNHLFNIAKQAFAIWAKHVQLNFVHQSYINNKKRVSTPNIIISFGIQRHHNYKEQSNCHIPFDGAGGVLGHAFYPTSSTTKSVDLHLDYQENWNQDLSQTKDDDRINLFEVLVHEIGHTLGIAHSTYENSVMYPLHSKQIFSNISEFKLSNDDINAIKKLYKSKITNVSPPKVPTVKISKHPELCDLDNVNTFLIVDDNILIFYEQWVWFKKLDEYQHKAVPFYIPTWLPFLPANFEKVSAAYRRPNGNIVLIVNNKSYNIIWPTLELVNQNIALYNVDIHNISGAVNTYTGHTYIFYDKNHLLEIDECKFTTKSYGVIHKHFPGIPADIDGVFRYTNGRIYFFKNKNYYEYNEFLNVMTKAEAFHLSLLNINCPNIGVLEQLKNLVLKLISYRQY